MINYRIRTEPAAIVGLIIAILQIILAVITNQPWPEAAINSLMTFFGALGIRQMVTPNKKVIARRDR